MTDRELLERAAKAAGIEWDEEEGHGWYQDDGCWTWWNPLTDDGDALRLAVTLLISVNPGHGYTVCAKAKKHKSGWTHEYVGRDLAAATRRAIVRAAAELAK